MVPWWSIHSQTDHATIRTTLTLHPENRLLWQFTTVTFFHLYNPSTQASRWTVCHMWHNVHPPRNALWPFVHPFLKWNLGGLPQNFWTHLWWSAGFLATCGHFVTEFFKTRLRCPAGFTAKRGGFVAWFLDIVIYCRLLSKMWMFCHRIFLAHLRCPAGFSVKSGHFVAWFLATFVMSKGLLREMWMFCHRIYAQILMVLSEEKKVRNFMRQSLTMTCGLLHVLAELCFYH